MARLLKKNGILVLSIDKDQPDITYYGSRKVKMYPDNKESILSFVENAKLSIKYIEDIENAYVIIAY